MYNILYFSFVLFILLFSGCSHETMTNPIPLHDLTIEEEIALDTSKSSFELLKKPSKSQAISGIKVLQQEKDLLKKKKLSSTPIIVNSQSKDILRAKVLKTNYTKQKNLKKILEKKKITQNKAMKNKVVKKNTRTKMTKKTDKVDKKYKSITTLGLNNKQTNVNNNSENKISQQNTEKNSSQVMKTVSKKMPSNPIRIEDPSKKKSVIDIEIASIKNHKSRVKEIISQLRGEDKAKIDVLLSEEDVKKKKNNRVEELIKKMNTMKVPEEKNLEKEKLNKSSSKNLEKLPVIKLQKDAIKVEEKEDRDLYNIKKVVGDKVCRDARGLLNFVCMDFIALVQDVKEDRIKVKIIDSQCEKSQYNGIGLYKNTVLWDKYNDWKVCN